MFRQLNFRSFFNFLGRNKLYAAINIFGLSVSLMFVILIADYTLRQLTCDDYHAKADRIYVIGNWGGWYYPYAVTYTYSTGSFITELLNLEATQGEKEKLPILWTSYMSGLLSGSTAVNTKLAIEGVNQAYTQSSYLTNK